MLVFTRSIGAGSLPEVPYVLLVDDEEASFRPLAELVRYAGFTSVVARSATDALACCYQRRPDIVVTDLVMPGPDGRALARRVRRRFPCVPILLVSGQNLEEPDWTVPADLFDAIFAKPLDFDRFIKIVGFLMSTPPRRPGQPKGRA
jgi:CheY-like chemotaxis protein